MAANDNWTHAQQEAVDELFERFDLIATRPLPCEIEFELQRKGLL